jgi:hypothetical protein
MIYRPGPSSTIVSLTSRSTKDIRPAMQRREAGICEILAERPGIRSSVVKSAN